jgi:hypothetical protein
VKQGWIKIKEFVNENPIAAIVVASLAANAAAKVLHEVVAAKNSRTYAKEIDRRTRL